MIIGITGGLATGTSTAAKFLSSELKARLIDADRLSDQILDRKGAVHEKIVKSFGRDIVDKKGSIQRCELAQKVFGSKKSLDKLCSIMHPAILKEIESASKASLSRNRAAAIVVDAPVLIECGYYKKCDFIVIVTASLIQQLERAKKHKKIFEKDALLRIQFQMPLYKKAWYADYIIDNGAGLAQLKERCRGVAREIKAKKERR